MRKTFVNLLCSTLILLFSEVSAQVNFNTLPDDERSDGWELLFDGRTLGGWRGYNQESIPAGWSAENGCLITSGTGGDLGGDIITLGQYEDFELYLEWAISAGGNSGIFYHVIEGDYPAAYCTGPEYQLIDDAGFPQQLEPWQQAGADYAMYPADPLKKRLRPVGEFNSSRIRVRDQHVTYWLNGEVIVDFDLWSPDWHRRAKEGKWKDYPAYGLARKGHIGLQDHGSHIRFRNIKVKDLTNSGVSLLNGKDLEGWEIYGTENGEWLVEKGAEGTLTGASKSAGGYSYLGTEKEYRDFILRLEFRLAADGNSGVFFRSEIHGTDITGWQVEVAAPGENTGGIYESGGRGWLSEIPDGKENILMPGEWNDMVILLKGDRVMTWLNGQMMTDLADEKIGRGKGIIALQVHSGGGVAVMWRNIFLREL